MSFTLTLTLALIGAALAAALTAPLAAPIVATLGFHFPFPRIFDRTVMLTVAAALLCGARRLSLWARLRAGFSQPRANFSRALRGLTVALAAMAVLWASALMLGGGNARLFARLWPRTPGMLAAALLIAVVEEAFFRALVLGGLRDDFGPRPALALSAATYALAHLLRSPARFELYGLHPLAGWHLLMSSLSPLAHPVPLLPAFVGLFLLGLVLGEAFLLTGTVYFSLGLHAGFVLGAKLWRLVAPVSGALPRWLTGYSPPPLLSGAAAWAIALAILVLLRPLIGKPAKA